LKLITIECLIKQPKIIYAASVRIVTSYIS